MCVAASVVVELVISDRHEHVVVEFAVLDIEKVHAFDHMPAFVGVVRAVRHHRRRQKVAGMDQHDVGSISFDRLPQRPQPMQAPQPAVANAVQPVGVVDCQKGDAPLGFTTDKVNPPEGDQTSKRHEDDEKTQQEAEIERRSQQGMFGRHHHLAYPRHFA